MVKFALIQDAWAKLYRASAVLIEYMADDSTPLEAELKANECQNIIVDISGLLSLSPTAIMQRKIALNAIKYSISVTTNERSARLKSKVMTLLCCSNKEIRIMAKHKEKNPVEFVTASLLEELSLDESRVVADWNENSTLVHTAVEQFARERGWLGSYSNNLLRISLGTEVGEVGKELEWIPPDTEIGLDKKSSIVRELADVGIYLCHIIRVNKELQTAQNCQCT